MTLDSESQNTPPSGPPTDSASPVLNPLARPVSTNAAIPRKRRVTQRVATIALVLMFACGGLFVAFGAGMIFERSVVAEQSEAQSSSVPDTFDNAWQIVLEHYVDKNAIHKDVMLEAAIEAMLDTLGDQGHTRYLTAEETLRDRESSRGTYEGVGILVEPQDDKIVVVIPFEGSPAFEAGVLPGDVIVEVNGNDVRGVPLDQVISMIRGPEGSVVQITFERPPDGELVTFDLERREIEISSVSWTMLEGDIAFIKLSQFTSGSGDDVQEALREAQEAGAKGVIFDLRNNPGGFVSEAIQVASTFIPEDSVVFISQTRDGGTEEHMAEPQPVHIGDLPLVVLINEHSASASEIVSGAIKAAGTATLIGESTIGTGTVLNQFELGDGSTIWLGVELWLTPEGELIRNQGIQPEIVVGLAEDQIAFVPRPGSDELPLTSELNDNQLEYGLNLLLERSAAGNELAPY